ncbi:MAG: hypothetical protein J5982_01320 [Bacilli bacterium]|nr:hypothetical protein [Bacilli bacterium]
MIFICIAQIVISIIATLALVYQDSNIFGNTSLFEDAQKLISSVYSQSWWALILFSLSFASLLTLTSLVYKKLEYEFLSIGCIVLMIIPSININGSLMDTLITLALFIPIIIIKIIGYKTEEKKIIELNEIKKEIRKKTSKK